MSDDDILTLIFNCHNCYDQRQYGLLSELMEMIQEELRDYPANSMLVHEFESLQRLVKEEV
jgi:hypothetical protein